jgi:hypothetical protein
MARPEFLKIPVVNLQEPKASPLQSPTGSSDLFKGNAEYFLGLWSHKKACRDFNIVIDSTCYRCVLKDQCR